MQKLLIRFLILFISITFLSCKTFYQPTSVKYYDYRINEKPPVNSSIQTLLKPYSDSVNKNMNDVIAVSGMVLEKKQPEGTLGNILADAMLLKAIEKYEVYVDVAVVNSGGIRIQALQAGNVTRGKVFELAPFDNIIVLLKVKGSTLQQFLDVAASKGGWPCAGCTYQIKDNKAINVTVAKKSISSNITYTIAVVDYLANGGDYCDMLKPIPQQNNGYLFRDAILEYFGDMQKQGRKLFAQLENRVTNAK